MKKVILFSLLKIFRIIFPAVLLLPTITLAQATWTQKANFGGTPRYLPAGFSIGTKGYMGTGWTTGGTNDFWEWDQATNVWTQRANFAGSARGYAVGFSIGTKGYIGTGYNGSTYLNDFWEY